MSRYPLALVVSMGLLSLAGCDNFPILFKPSIPVMILGIALVPILILPLLIKVAIALARGKRYPYTAYLFLGFQFSLFFLELSFVKDAFIFLVCNCLISTGVICEIRFRGLWKIHKFIACASIAVTIVWYLAIVCIMSAASV